MPNPRPILKRSKEEMEQIVKDMFAQCEKTDDLWELDKIVSRFFIDDYSPSYYNEGLYDTILQGYRDWVSKRWSKRKILFDGENLFSMLYEGKDSYVNRFIDKIKEEGFESQECYVSYEFGFNPRYEEEGSYPSTSSDGRFIMAFDVFDYEEGEDEEEFGRPRVHPYVGPGFAAFSFAIDKWGRKHEFSGKVITDPKELGMLSERDEINYEILMGHGTFYSHKPNHPYATNVDVYSDCGMILRLD